MTGAPVLELNYAWKLQAAHGLTFYILCFEVLKNGTQYVTVLPTVYKCKDWEIKNTLICYFIAIGSGYTSKI